MNRIINLARLNLIQLARDRAGLATLIVMPLMLTFIFGTVMGGGERKVHVAIADLDDSAYSREVAAALPAASYLLSRVDEATARRMTASGEVADALIIPAGFGADVTGGIDTTVTLVEDPRTNATLAVAEAVRGRIQRIAANGAVIRIVRRAFAEASRLTGSPQAAPSPDDIYAYANQSWEPTPPLSVREAPVTASRVRGASTGAGGFQQYSLGFTLMFMLFMGMGSAGGFLDEREQGTLPRLLTTPTSKLVLVAGKVVGIYITVLLEAALLVGFGAFVFGVPWGDDPLGVVLIMVTFALAATGLGVMVSTLVKTRGQMSAATAVAATALSMLGGAYWPLDILNPTMRTLAYLTPTGWAMTGLTNVVVRYQGAGQAVVPALVLAGMAAVFLVIGVSRLRLE